MIKLIKNLPEYENTDFPFVRIACNFAAYGEFEKIALFWAQTDDCGRVTALICMIDGDMTITEKNADTDELKEFICAIAPKTVLCGKDTADKLNLKIQKTCTVLKCVPEYDTKNAIENTGEGISRLYELLSCEFELEKEAFTADISHRVRHNCAFFITSRFSAAVCLYCENFAMINGICVDSSKRNTGIGSATLSRVKSGIRNKTLFVATQGAEEFYIKNNFTVCGQAAYCLGI